MKTFFIFLILGSVLFPRLGTAASASLPNGFGKATWGMTKSDLIAQYRIVINPPDEPTAGGVWAVEGPAPGELTVSGEGLGEAEFRSVSFGIHPKWGLAIIHVRFKERLGGAPLDGLVAKWTSRYGPPKERVAGPKLIWEDGATHIELTYHIVSPLHPTPSDHLALVLWSIPLMDKIESQSPSGDEGAPLEPFR